MFCAFIRTGNGFQLTMQFQLFITVQILKIIFVDFCQMSSCIFLEMYYMQMLATYNSKNYKLWKNSF